MADAPDPTPRPTGDGRPARGAKAGFSLVVGLVMLGLGSWIALHPLWSREFVTGQRWTDLAFAFFFLLRGALYLRSLRRAR